MTKMHPSQIDPVTDSFQISTKDKVATMGSCFAQHLSRFILKSGASYFVSENAPDNMSQEEKSNNNYGVFSARYGNVYTVEQALQLFDRAYGKFKPSEDIWKYGDNWVDAIRPQIKPGGYENIDELLESREIHFSAVREVFEKSEVFVFTLGLTEAWRSKIDGTVYPVAPGVSGGSFDENLHEFHNFSMEEVTNGLISFIERIKSVNENVKILLTISPVPLIATYENRHVLVSTTLSKSILRVAADIAANKYKDVYYFPSYEIITSPATCSDYYEDDLRQVKDIGVKHVMRTFGKHFLVGDNSRHEDNQGYEFQDSNVVCDEELIERSLAISNNKDE